VTRHPEAFPIPADDRLRVQRGDILDAGDVEQAVAGAEAVLTTVGAPFSFAPVTVYSEGIRNIIRAMRATGVRRVVAVTSGATDPRFDRRDGLQRADVAARRGEAGASGKRSASSPGLNQ
jgi:nucleoside-diphosphate-sugar epimerase